ncbi:hypothetical protein H6P1_00162 (plasmid) [Variovorax sp. PBL-H6]|nr:hypothetical protein H6P1_00162 [Variovorax sp. PBL-H6]VTU44035.1 hypothetical protein SRS16P1_00740 [Variovorax sp. SRS16]VTU44120.1 hypothetical protein E5P1_00733 [Variovorax sp. PBL-E5]
MSCIGIPTIKPPAFFIDNQSVIKLHLFSAMSQGYVERAYCPDTLQSVYASFVDHAIAKGLWEVKDHKLRTLSEVESESWLGEYEDLVGHMSDFGRRQTAAGEALGKALPGYKAELAQGQRPLPASTRELAKGLMSHMAASGGMANINELLPFTSEYGPCLSPRMTEELYDLRAELSVTSAASSRRRRAD